MEVFQNIVAWVRYTTSFKMHSLMKPLVTIVFISMHQHFTTWGAVHYKAICIPPHVSGYQAQHWSVLRNRHKPFTNKVSSVEWNWLSQRREGRWMVVTIHTRGSWRLHNAQTLYSLEKTGEREARCNRGKPERNQDTCWTQHKKWLSGIGKIWQ